MNRPGRSDDTDPLKGLLDSDLAKQVKASAQQIWLAGMGAFARAQAEGGKVFEGLVKEGASLQKKTQGAAEETFADVGERMSGFAGEWQAKAGQQWEKLEGVFQERTVKTLAKLGVPTAADLVAVNARLDAIDAKLAALAKAAAPSRAPARPAAAKKATLKKSSTAKAAAAKQASSATLKRSPARKPSST